MGALSGFPCWVIASPFMKALVCLKAFAGVVVLGAATTGCSSEHGPADAAIAGGNDGAAEAALGAEPGPDGAVKEVAADQPSSPDSGDGRSDYNGLNPIPANPAVEEVKAGYGFTEGPVWLASSGELLFSDIPQNTIWRHKPPASF